MLTGNDSFRYLLSKTVECPTEHPLLNCWVLDNGDCPKCGRNDIYVTAVNRQNEIEPKQLLGVRFLCDRCLEGEYYPVRV